MEVLFPIEDEEMRRYIVEHILEVYLRDTAKAYALQGDGTYNSRSENTEDGEELFNSQLHFLLEHTGVTAD